VIMIAHRTSTLRSCEAIYRVEGGVVHSETSQPNT